MIGIKGVPLTASFEWARWRPTKSALIAMGATEVMTDAQAKRLGYRVDVARRVFEIETADLEAARKLTQSIVIPKDGES